MGLSYRSTWLCDDIVISRIEFRGSEQQYSPKMQLPPSFLPSRGILSPDRIDAPAFQVGNDVSTELAQPDESTGAILSIGVTAPITTTGGPHPVFGITPATDTAAGSLSGADKNYLDSLATRLVVDVTQHGVVGDAYILIDGNIGAGGTVLTSASATFTPADVAAGKIVLIPQADANHNQLCTHIVGPFVDAHTVNVADAATFAVAGGPFAYGTDNAAASNALISASSLLTTGSVEINWPPTPSNRGYLYRTGMQLFAGTRLRGYGANIIGALNSASFDGTGLLFWNQSGNDGASIPLHATVPIGSSSIQIDGAVTKGSRIVIVTSPGNGLDGTYQVLGVSGAAPQTVTLDRSTLQTFAATGTTIDTLTTPCDNMAVSGFTIMGRATRYMEMADTWHSTFRDLTFDCRLLGTVCTPSLAQGSSILFGNDGASYGSNWSDIEVLGSATGVAFEGAESCAMDGFRFDALGTAQFAATAAFDFNQCYASTLSNFTIAGAFNGVVIEGSFACTATLGVISNIVNNAYVLNASTKSTIRSCRALSPMLSAIQEDRFCVGTVVEDYYFTGGGTGAAVLVSAAGADATWNTIYFVPNSANAGDVFIGLVFLGAGVTRVRGLTVVGGGVGRCLAVGVRDDNAVSPTVLIDGFDITSLGDQGAILIQASATTRVMLRNGKAKQGNGAAQVIASNGGITDIDDTTVVGTAAQGIYSFGATATFRLGDNIIFSGSFTTHVRVDSGFCNRFATGLDVPLTVTLNGATPVLVPYPDLQTGERLELVSVANKNGATGSDFPVVTDTPGTGSSVVSVVTDTRIWNAVFR